MEPKNYIELAPRLCTQTQPLVIRAEKVGTMLRVIEPHTFRLSWSVVKAKRWKEVDHEPGPVTVEEWRELVGK